MKDLEQDPEFQALIRSVSFPGVEPIAAFARSKGIKQVHEFWDLFDFVNRRWREERSCEGSSA